jgi:hypothetical protein
VFVQAACRLNPLTDISASGHSTTARALSDSVFDRQDVAPRSSAGTAISSCILIATEEQGKCLQRHKRG